MPRRIRAPADGRWAVSPLLMTDLVTVSVRVQALVWTHALISLGGMDRILFPLPPIPCRSPSRQCDCVWRLGFKEIIKDKRGRKSEDWCPWKKGKRHQVTWGHGKKALSSGQGERSHGKAALPGPRAETPGLRTQRPSSPPSAALCHGTPG